jgi:hypothetical protein
LLSCHADELTDDGRRRLARHGHLPEREIMTGIGPVAVRCPRVRDRGGEGSERLRFSSAILPRSSLVDIGSGSKTGEAGECSGPSRSTMWWTRFGVIYSPF